ncbi:GNAT family N-acetyltransferase [Robertmurraya korlensis]|uniref:GNAT family N-acetyltransferase n=1 Tax=Robertmurraya korlensis TaxID=519977 RepID=UPI000826AF57|nr:GNAT family N-acetyltransferase [Robertmurraya korlensis]
MEFVKNYKDQMTLRHSFNNLATSTFGIQFEEWYEKGYWNERYIPYSFVVKNKVIANVSVNVLTLLIDGQEKKAVQLGTVMKDENYRNKGLSRMLLQKVIDDYDEQVDLYYLFANRTVLEFYPKFGFNRKKEHLFSKNLPSTQHNNSIRKLHLETDIDVLRDFSKNRKPVSQKFSTLHTEGINFFHFLHVFSNDLYYDESNESILIYQLIDGDVHLFDCLSKKVVNLDKQIQTLSSLGGKVYLHFTPDHPENYEVHPIDSIDDVLFVKTKFSLEFPAYFKHPITSQA